MILQPLLMTVVPKGRHGRGVGDSWQLLEMDFTPRYLVHERREVKQAGKSYRFQNVLPWCLQEAKNSKSPRRKVPVWLTFLQGRGLLLRNITQLWKVADNMNIIHKMKEAPCRTKQPNHIVIKSKQTLNAHMFIYTMSKDHMVFMYCLGRVGIWVCGDGGLLVPQPLSQAKCGALATRRVLCSVPKLSCLAVTMVPWYHPHEDREVMLFIPLPR